uniref:Uncharacterized protein n=1 Tax=Anopheles culicifacies TaxID=139723 RepID=A0A182MED1_9DIPT
MPTSIRTVRRPGQLGNVATSSMAGPMYIGGTVMGQQTAQPATPQASFSTSAQQSPARYLQTVQHHQPSMSPVQQRPDFQPTVADFVAASAPGPYSGVQQAYKQQPQRQAQPMQSYQEAPTTSSYPVHVQSSLHPEGSTTEAQYFFGKQN